jgi:hypothetical protein
LPDICCARHADCVITADEKLTIRPSPPGAVLIVAWILFLCLLMAGAAKEHDRRGLLMLICLPWLVPVVLLGRFRLSVAGDALIPEPAADPAMAA